MRSDCEAKLADARATFLRPALREAHAAVFSSVRGRGEEAILRFFAPQRRHAAPTGAMFGVDEST